ncbi:MFS transporter [Burkholderia gladioli]|uniref:MFS transporter n=1 Tax=Burkholderia gladioli TaxID=28095 RepID=UPI001364A8DB|nr:MFS transporter [Burkholderia gladioli]KAF1058728.1 Purine efflux pump PbuE [Burkholderia gladioli]WAG22889.1 MFS transporter [Burkholderia gladioli]
MDRRLLALALGMFALGTDSFVVAGVLPRIAHEFGIGIGAAGQMTTVYSLSYALLAPLIATLAAGVARKRLILIGLAIFVIANLGTALAPRFGFALATRALAGLGASIFSPTATGSAAAIVPPERRGMALAVVLTGMTVSTAIGAPIGTLIGSFVSWHWTMVFVAALAALSGLGVLAFLAEIPLAPPISLRKCLAPLGDARVGLTMASTVLFFSGVLAVYTYLAVVFDRAIGADSALIGGLLVLWGAAGTVSNLAVGRLIDRIGTRRVLAAMLAFVFVDFLLVRWSGASLWTTIPAIVVWGACGWGVLVPMQHRIVGVEPALAPILMGLNNSATFLGATAAGAIGAAGIHLVGSHALGFVGAALVGAAMIVSAMADRRIAAVARAGRAGGELPVVAASRAGQA